MFWQLLLLAVLATAQPPIRGRPSDITDSNPGEIHKPDFVLVKKECRRHKVVKHIALDTGACTKFCPGNLQNGAVQHTAGTTDGYATTGTPDPLPVPSLDLQGAQPLCKSPLSLIFDSPSPQTSNTPKFLCHTFTDVRSTCPIKSATVKTCIRACTNCWAPLQTHHETVMLGFDGVVSWTGYLPQLNSGGWEPGYQACFTFDLTNLPTAGTNVVPQLLAAGSLDFQVQGYSSVDSVTLSLTTEPCYQCLERNVNMAMLIHPTQGTTLYPIVAPDPKGCGCLAVNGCKRVSKVVTYPGGKSIDVGQCVGGCPNSQNCEAKKKAVVVSLPDGTHIEVTTIDGCKCK